MSQDMNAAFDHCQNLARAHYENFPVASRLVAAEKRKYIWAVYAFARTADDFADERNNPEESLRLLADWDQKLDLCLTEPSTHPIFAALAKTIQDCQIPPSLLHDLVEAFRRDVTRRRHATFDDLLEYCRFSANPVGRLVLLIHDYQDIDLFTLSDKICTALQLANFWQDVSVDLKKNRIYLPLELLSKHQYREQELFKGIQDFRFVSAVQEAISFTRDLFYQGLPLLASLKKDLRFEIRLTWLGGMKILEKIEKKGCRVLKYRPKLRRWDKFQLFGQALRGYPRCIAKKSAPLYAQA